MWLERWVGLILGHPIEGVIIGAAIQLPYIAYISAGGTIPSDPGLAGVLGTAFAIVGGMDPATAITIAVPFGLLGTAIWILHMTVDVTFVHLADKAAERGIYIRFVSTTSFRLRYLCS